MKYAFKTWLNEAENRDVFKNTLLNRLNLSKEQGLSTPVNTWEPEELLEILRGMGEFTKLPENIKQKVVSQIENGVGTLTELLNNISPE